jgi:hypothetical protein
MKSTSTGNNIANPLLQFNYRGKLPNFLWVELFAVVLVYILFWSELENE